MTKPLETSDEILEQNVSTLLESGGDAPRMAPAARLRIREHLVERFGAPSVTGAWRRPRTWAIAGGAVLAAAAVIALVVGHGVPGEPAGSTADTGALALADGTTVLRQDGAEVTVLGPRHLRVRGEVLLDVAPGKGTFVVETARGRIEVLGTRFLVDAEAGSTTAAVVRGEVKLASDGGDVVLHAGEEGIAEAGRAPTRRPAPRLSHLASWAQAARAKLERAEPPHHGTLFARLPNVPNAPEQPLPLARLRVDIVVDHQVARVALDQTFRNESPQELEGSYRFAIPPEAALQRFAMYVDGKLTESAVVERMAARRIYEEQVYRHVDPALLEYAGTGKLALRVYPLHARQDKRLVVAYTQSLPKLYDDWTLTVPLPDVDQPVGELAFDVRVKGCASCELSSPSHAIAVARSGDDAIVTYRAKNARGGDSLVLRVRDPRRAPSVVTAHEGSDRYLMVRAAPDLAADVPAGPAVYQPRTWVILDDVSASRDAMALRAQRELVDGFLRELDEQDRVAVVAFDVTARVVLAPTRVIDVDRAAVQQQLAREGGVGATDVGAGLAAALAQLPANSSAADASIVYLGDGVVTSGERQLGALRGQIGTRAQWVGVGVGEGPDTQTLSALADATGGYATTIDLADDLGWRAFDLVAALHTPRVSGLRAQLVDAVGAPVVATTYAPAQLADGEELELVAKLDGKAPAPAALELTGSLAGRPWTRRIALEGSGSGDARYLPRLWAQRHVAARLLAKHDPVDVPVCGLQLRGAPCATEQQVRDARDEVIRREVVELGKRYFLLSRHTSLLVLENDAMYAQYGIAKGSGDTWAPYALPATIPTQQVPASASLVADASDAPVVRERPSSPTLDNELENQLLQTGFGGEAGGAGGLEPPVVSLHYRAGPGPIARHVPVPTPKDDEAQRQAVVVAIRTSGVLGAVRDDAGDDRGKLGTADPEPSTSTRAPMAVLTTPTPAPARAAGHADGMPAPAPMSDAAASAAADKPEATDVVEKKAVLDAVGGGYALGRRTSPWGGHEGAIGGLWGERQGLALPFQSPDRAAFADLTSLVPALFADAVDGWRAAIGAPGASQPVDPAARTLLVRARAALPTGVYRWGDLEIAVDDARRIGWRRTTEDDLAETASFDGTTWTRRYAELGLDVTRAVGTDDVALALGVFPIWIASPEHWAAYFAVRSRGPREIELGRDGHTAFVLVFDDAAHLVAVRDGAGRALVQVTWGPTGPTTALAAGAQVPVGFTGQAIADAGAWAHRGALASSVVVELPARGVGFWESRRAAATPGDPAWRFATRQQMVALDAALERADASAYAVAGPDASRAQLLADYRALAAHGGVDVGDALLASPVLGTALADADRATIPAGAVATYLGQRYWLADLGAGDGASRTGVWPATTAEPGAIGARGALRAIAAELQRGHSEAAVSRLASLGERAPAVRVRAAMAIEEWSVPEAIAVRAWNTFASGRYHNVARMRAAMAYTRHGHADEAAARYAELAADYDLGAEPVDFSAARYVFPQSRRGATGWQLASRQLRDRVLAEGGFDHVLALLSSADEPSDRMRILERAAALAAGDPAQVAQVAARAADLGELAWASALVKPVLVATPTRELAQLGGRLALRQDQLSDALADLETAQKLDANDAAPMHVVRAELGQLVAVASRIALSSQGAARQDAIAHAVRWGARWREIDPGSPLADLALGDLMLGVGDAGEAWRQLSTMIERDPMSGQGYEAVANAFERQGKVGDALGFWEQALRLDQTDPTPRLRKAQALFALGREAEGVAALRDITTKRWHERWWSTVESANELLAQHHG